ncbi:MAG TPA: hypothetical protein VH253_20160 [Phycisphaerae bacterium]|nr:hypothetical protein [Phycisphaerae bacterium]
MRTCNPSPHARRLRAGFTLLEAVILVTILGIVGVGVGIGLQATARVPEGVEDRLSVQTLLMQKMEEVSTISFASLAAGKDDSGNALSDTVTVKGKTANRTVTVAAADADGDGNPDADFLEITVTINGQSLKTRVCKP